MKKQHRRWISLFLVFGVYPSTVFFLMFPELHQAASQFHIRQSQSCFFQIRIRYCMPRQISYEMLIFCTEDLLGIQSRDASSLRGVRDGRRSNAKVRVFLSLVHILDSKISYISEMADCTCIGNITFSCRTILRYIQRQDGKKPL